MPLYGLLALALLMIVHECGHFFVARAFGMRVDRFSIGFGPPIWRHRPKNSDTTYQVALIPFLAYVQIAGMNPFEESDADDKGSYANASLVGRISAIIAGPLANYLFASVLFFASLMLGGKQVETTVIEVMPNGAAATAGLRDGDRVTSIAGQHIDTWEQMRTTILARPNQRLELELERDGKPLHLSVTPRPLGKDGGGLIGVRPEPAPMPLGEAARAAVIQPAAIVALTVRSLYRMITGREEGQLTGPIGIMRETEKAAELGLPVYLSIIGFLSTSVGFFNMLPLPALDGGRLLFLGYEAVTRRRPNQKVEAQIHAFGMLMLLAAIALVSFREWGSDKTPSEEATEKSKKTEKPSGSKETPPATSH
ncbi:MAG TPA: M50 family metallopeptidase [Polyangiaceae bacterium]|nr:M50 family metallopeptidase [Polyangiaceae bacterium]